MADAAHGRDPLAQALSGAIDGEVRFGDGDRALYAADASNFREVPRGVVIPRSMDEMARIIALCARHGAAVVHRGGGTSLAGQTVSAGAVVIDSSKYCNRILDIDPQARLARVEPGVVLDDLRAAAGRHGLTFGPDPATHSHNTLGGMLGNNSCGVHSLYARRETFPQCLEVTAETTEGNVIMGVRHRDLPVEAVQFHPESILTLAPGSNYGLKLIENAVKMAVEQASRAARF